MNINIETNTFTTTARDGMRLVLMTVVWMGRIVEVDTYRASDMAQIETKTLKAVA